jgi:hypothetical protein
MTVSELEMIWKEAVQTEIKELSLQSISGRGKGFFLLPLCPDQL